MDEGQRAKRKKKKSNQCNSREKIYQETH